MSATWKKIFVAAIAVWMAAFCGNAIAQRRIPVFGTLTFGPSFALDNFARDNPQNGAYANTGVNIKISGGILLTKHLGIELMANATFSPINDPYWGSGASYNYNSLLIGPIVSLPVSNRFFVDLRPSVGVVRQQLSLGFATDAYGTGFAMDMGVGVRYFLSSVWFLVLDTDYFRSEVKYRNGYRNINTSNLNVTIGGGIFL